MRGWCYVVGVLVVCCLGFVLMLVLVVAMWLLVFAGWCYWVGWLIAGSVHCGVY